MKHPKQTAVFECQCGTTHNSADGQLPVGWATRHGHVWCADCSRSGIASRQITTPRRRRAA
jgi:hypothetical protein